MPVNGFNCVNFESDQMAALFVQRMAIYYNDNHTIGLTFCQIPNTSKHLKFDFKNLPKWQDSTKSGHNCKFVPNLCHTGKILEFQSIWCIKSHNNIKIYLTHLPCIVLIPCLIVYHKEVFGCNESNFRFETNRGWAQRRFRSLTMSTTTKEKTTTAATNNKWS